MLNSVMAWRFLNILTDLAQTGQNCGFRGKGDLFLSRYETFCVANTRRYHRSLHGPFFALFQHFFRLPIALLEIPVSLTHEKLFQCVTLSQFLAA